MKIADSLETIVYGGTFNPPTFAHQAVIENCQRAKPDADIWVMPSGLRWDKQHETPNVDRLEMIGLMIANLKKPDSVQVCTMEIEDPELTETWRSVGKLARLHPDRNFRYVFGSDSYLSMPSWHQGKELQETLPMLVVRRGEDEISPADNIDVLDVEIPEISSTEARLAAEDGLALGNFVCGGIESYIRDRGLYGAAESVA